MKPTIVCVVGPTAVGKTALSIEIAQHFNGEVISGDSMQVYRGMDIATAKVTQDEQQNIPHYLLDILEPDESFSVFDFKTRVTQIITDMNERGRLPIIAGGTGMYLDSLIRDYALSEEKRDPEYERKIEADIEKLGIDAVYNRLVEVDPNQAKKTHKNNVRRVIRALEVYDRTGQTMTDYQQTQRADSPYNVILIGLDMDRTLLYARINARVDQMVEHGLFKEARYFYDLGLKDAPSMRAIGYKELIGYFEGTCSKEEAIDLLKRNSRRYAKRQLTWFRNKMDINWYTLTPETKNDVFQKILKDLAGILPPT
ncbi:tRNA dimethylallyltransferase [Halolactibacillus halophilus]|uniref:tRNA dimethylallyltransferase n=1 Tax=Halolactibacillus halophilus TaxID=306540 RepID=A0A1I5LG11_9BACI|nr:tRNA (adenosine(37)-N6)-dimethylallyltransferase MiaA [Halolactibacillus halophilus]GEM00840.1 tRNA dimethylallyltransferase [Halolactibacillus halophilus]SFO96147.1 tRNA dimethylallyltransferase [Halolactibacillus halophilus]